MQYVFIYQALLEHYLYGDTELEVTSLEIHLQKIYNKVPGTSSNGLEEEFKVSVAGVLSWWICWDGAGITWHWGALKIPSALLLALQKLTSIKIQNDKMRTGNLPANMKKNRVLQIIPCKACLAEGLVGVGTGIGLEKWDKQGPRDVQGKGQSPVPGLGSPSWVEKQLGEKDLGVLTDCSLNLSQQSVLVTKGTVLAWAG